MNKQFENLVKKIHILLSSAMITDEINIALSRYEGLPKCLI